MNCSKCASVSPEGSPFCSTCGASLLIGGIMPPMPAPPPADRTSGMAIAGFVCSFVCGLLGLIFSAMGYSECKKSNGAIKGQGLALAGLIISIVSMGFAVLGILAAVAIPSFLGSMQKSKPSEAMLNLRRIGDGAKINFITSAEFPRGNTPLTPSTNCCDENAGGRRRCSSQSGNWNASPIWQQLDFDMYGDHYFQYSYRSDGQSFTAQAVGDLDCDGVAITYELHGRVVDGNPQLDPILEPPPNSD